MDETEETGLVADHPAADPEPDITGRRNIRGGKKRLWHFARLLKAGMDPYEAFVQSGHPVMGVNADRGWDEHAARERASFLAVSQKVVRILEGQKADEAAHLKRLIPVARKVFRAVMKEATLLNGEPDWNARMRAAENVMDRAGMGRGQKVEQTRVVKDESEAQTPASAFRKLRTLMQRRQVRSITQTKTTVELEEGQETPALPVASGGEG